MKSLKKIVLSLIIITCIFSLDIITANAEEKYNLNGGTVRIGWADIENYFGIRPHSIELKYRTDTDEFKMTFKEEDADSIKQEGQLTVWEFKNVEYKNANEDGLYYLWLMGSDDDIKTIYGYLVVEIGTVEKIVDKVPSTENQGGSTQTPSTGGQSTDTQNPQESGNSGATNQNPTSGNQNNGSSTEQTPSTGTSSTQKVADDGTTAKTKLPNTGKGIILVMAMILIIITGGISKIKYNTYKDIK